MVGAQAKLKLAMQLHQRGDLQAAEANYSQVLSLEPNNYTALINIATIYLNKGEWQRAERSLKWASLVNEPNPELIYKLGFSLQQQGKLDEAIKAFNQALALKKNFAEAFTQLGIAYHQQGKLDEAIATYQKATVLCPTDSVLHCKLGIAFYQQRDFDQAIILYQQAIAIQPNYVEAYSNLGIAYKEMGLIDEAIHSYQKAISINPLYPIAYSNLGLALAEQGLFDEAVLAYQQAIQLQPDLPDTYYNLGLSLYKQDNVQGAIASYQRAIQLKPNLPDVHYHLGTALFVQGHIDESIQACQQELALNSEHADAHKGLALAFLLYGNYETGLMEYEWRFKASPLAYPSLPFEKWDGSLEGNYELIFVEEQGIGDIIQFIRYAKLLRPYFPNLSIILREPLCELIKSTNLFDNIYSLPLAISTIPAGAQWVHLLSVPFLSKTRQSTPLICESYISAPTHCVNHWYEKIHAERKLVIGLNWQGNPETEMNNLKGRSFPLSMYEPLASIPGVEFVSLQKGYGSEQLESCVFRDRFVSCQEEINQTWDWVETAGIVQNCDLIITSDTSIAHLAGALGKPVWILLKKLPDWRWGLEGETTPWYPSARLFRQAESGNWTQVIDQVKEALSKLISSSV